MSRDPSRIVHDVWKHCVLFLDADRQLLPRSNFYATGGLSRHLCLIELDLAMEGWQCLMSCREHLRTEDEQDQEAQARLCRGETAYPVTAPYHMGVERAIQAIETEIER